MTALAGRPAHDARTDVLPRPGTGDVPILVEGTHLYGCQPGSGYVNPPSLARRVDGQVLQLTPLLYAVLEAVDGRRDMAAIATEVSEQTGKNLHADDVRMLVEDKLRPLGLVLGADGTHPPLTKANPLLALHPRFVVSKPELTRRVTAPFARLFNPVLVTVATIAFAGVAFWVLFVKGLASAAHDAFTSPGLLLAVFAITVVSAGFHEFGHAAALRRSGGTPGAMGAGLYLIYPAFYTDVTDGYRLDRKARLRTDLGGLYFNALVALAMFALWAAVRWDGLLLVIAAQLLQMVRQLPPMVRYDGYHLLADITGVPDLWHRLGPTVRSFLPRRWRPDSALELKRWARVIVTLWVVIVIPLLLVTVVLTVVALPRILGTTAHSISTQAHLLSAAAGHGAWLAAGTKALAIAALIVPVGGIIFLLARVGRRYVTRIWVRTRGKPAKRAVAVVALLALAAGLAYAWWPGGGTYRPIQPGERGTVQDGVQAAVVRDRPAPALRDGEQRTTTTLWPGGQAALPTRAHPVLAVVLVPRDGNGPTWVFPFNRPDPPGPGDNQSMAVVTKDGGTAYDVAFALVWADGDTVLNRNEAYAFARCKGCRAVAVSFQVVLVVGHAHVQAPQNIAAAVSYKCLRCLTDALAVQLVLTVPDDLSADARQQLQALWTQISAFGDNLKGLTSAQIRAQLKDYEKEIVAIVDPQAVTSSVTEATPSASPETTQSPDVSATSSADAGTDASAVPEQTTGTAQQLPTPSTSSSPQPSESPSASMTPTPTATSTTTP